MKVYIAGKLGTKEERLELENIDSICSKLGLKTFLPHRDAGLAESISDVKRIFKADITDNLPDCDLVIVNLNGLHTGAGTAWELGYAYAKGIKVLGIKTDEPVEDALDYLSPMIIESVKIYTSYLDLEKGIKKLI